MPPFIVSLSVLSLLLILHQSSAFPHHRIHTSPGLEQGLSQTSSVNILPTTYFEVTKPIQLPNTRPCSCLILQHNFAYTYGKPPVTAPYSPPSDCPSKEFSTIVLEWSASCEGRQYDRIFGVWLGGVELLRSCTAEPRPTGILWKVEKDVTKYYSLLMKNNTLAVYLGNVVDSTYTGVYHVNITFHFYPAANQYHSVIGLKHSGSVYLNEADLIMPISRNDVPLKDGLWFEIENSTDIQGKKFKIPPNVYRAVLEVYVSFHEADEFWYSNLPNEYISANNLTSASGNGAFREILVMLDGKVVGAIWPFTVIYTGGINPLLWRPITGIGSFDLPTYDIEITPFLAALLDCKSHKIQFSVTNALNVWYVDANLHIWLDKESDATVAKLLDSQVLSLTLSSESDFEGLNGTFTAEANRSIFSSGWVNSSYGNITTTFKQNLSFTNYMLMGDNANLQIVNQTIHFNASVSTLFPSSSVYKMDTYKRFPLFLYTNQIDQRGDNYTLLTNVTLGYNEDKISLVDGESSSYVLRNLQEGDGEMVVKNNLVASGLGSTQEVYSYDGANKLCFCRNVSSSNYTILYDHTRKGCSEGLGSGLWCRLRKWMQAKPKAVLGL